MRFPPRFQRKNWVAGPSVVPGLPSHGQPLGGNRRSCEGELSWKESLELRDIGDTEGQPRKAADLQKSPAEKGHAS